MVQEPVVLRNMVGPVVLEPMVLGSVGMGPLGVGPLVLEFMVLPALLRTILGLRPLLAPSRMLPSCPRRPHIRRPGCLLRVAELHTFVRLPHIHGPEKRGIRLVRVQKDLFIRIEEQQFETHFREQERVIVHKEHIPHFRLHAVALHRDGITFSRDSLKVFRFNRLPLRRDGIPPDRYHSVTRVRRHSIPHDQEHCSKRVELQEAFLFRQQQLFEVVRLDFEIFRLQLRQHLDRLRQKLL